MTPEEFRRAAHELVDWVADYRTRVADLPDFATLDAHLAETRKQVRASFLRILRSPP